MKSESLSFDGMAGDGVNRAGNKWSGNQSGLTAKENYGMKAAARKGNDGVCAEPISGKSVTKDAYRRAPDTAKGGKIDGGASVKGFSNPDKINVGSK